MHDFEQRRAKMNQDFEKDWEKAGRHTRAAAVMAVLIIVWVMALVTAGVVWALVHFS